jgi:TnpA family transposase
MLTELQRLLQSAEVWAVGGRRYGNVEDLLIPRADWESGRDEYYADLELPKDPHEWLKPALEKLTSQIEKTAVNVRSNSQVFVEDGRVHLKKLDAEELPERIETLKQRVSESWPQIRIQDLLVEVDSWLDYTRYFRTLHGRREKLAEFGKGLLATLIAKGCNIGLVKMAALTPGLEQRTLRRVDEVYLYENTLRHVIEHLVKTHHSLPVAELIGDESVSMSDGMRIRTRVNTFNSAFMPKYFAPGHRAITYYWHISHQGPGYAAQVFGNDRDAAYVLDQILHIRSELPIQEHYTDTHGVTENVFGLAEAFGLQFAPRIKRIHAQQLYHPPDMKVSGPFKSHFARPVDVDLIEKHWDDYVRIIASIKHGLTSAVLLSQRLSSYADRNPLYRVIREIGRISKTRHLLRFYDEEAYRRRIISGLDRVENFNYLARHLFYARRGENWEREFEEQHNRASALLILANACVLWNSVHLSEIYQKLKSEGHDFLPEDFSHISPYAFEHIIPYGQYFFNLRRKKRQDAFSRAQRL